MKYQTLIETLALQPHPEGGYFRELYRAADTIPAQSLSPDYGGARSISTAIYFLLPGNTFSAFHRLRSDEIWHFYLGDTINLHLIHPDGRHECMRVGQDLLRGEQLQAVIPAGSWFAARVENTDGWALIGCTVAPGFDFADFELARRADLLARFPQHDKLIASFTRMP